VVPREVEHRAVPTMNASRGPVKGGRKRACQLLGGLQALTGGREKVVDRPYPNPA